MYYYYEKYVRFVLACNEAEAGLIEDWLTTAIVNNTAELTVCGTSTVPEEL